MYSIARQAQSTVARRSNVSARSVVGAPSRNYSASIHENNPELLESEKQKNLSGTQHHTSTPITGAPGWNEHLASASEATVKADRHATNGDPESLQKGTVDYVQARHSPEDQLSRREAGYDKDFVEGPLGGAGNPTPADAGEVHIKREVVEEDVKIK